MEGHRMGCQSRAKSRPLPSEISRRQVSCLGDMTSQDIYILAPGGVVKFNPGGYTFNPSLGKTGGGDTL
eukprot:scaffold63014_cov73-Cyclotella_meneghiniana.AAC.5